MSKENREVRVAKAEERFAKYQSRMTDLRSARAALAAADANAETNDYWTPSHRTQRIGRQISLFAAAAAARQSKIGAWTKAWVARGMYYAALEDLL